MSFRVWGPYSVIHYKNWSWTYIMFVFVEIRIVCHNIWILTFSCLVRLQMVCQKWRVHELSDCRHFSVDVSSVYETFLENESLKTLWLKLLLFKLNKEDLNCSAHAIFRLNILQTVLLTWLHILYCLRELSTKTISSAVKSVAYFSFLHHLNSHFFIASVLMFS